MASPEQIEKRDQLRLIRSENVGPVTWRKLMATYGSATRALAALPDLAQRGGIRKSIKVCSIKAAMDERDALKALGAKLLYWGDKGYPPQLAALEDAPPVLSVLGTPALLHRPTIALVGSRNASANGCRFAERLAADLGQAGLVVVSGLARGVDSAAHEGSLKTGTVAAMGGGLDVIYPPENENLYHRIRDAGALVSELPPGEKPIARHFPRRNRIISGLSLGVVVIEGAPRSGSLLTARFAADQGREVMAVPGSPLDPRALGPNGLIKNGAALVENAADVLHVLEPLLNRPFSEPDPVDFRAQACDPVSDVGVDAHLDAARGPLLRALDQTPIPVDELIRRCQTSPMVTSILLLELELAGRLNRHPGNLVSLKSLDEPPPLSVR